SYSPGARPGDESSYLPVWSGWSRGRPGPSAKLLPAGWVVLPPHHRQLGSAARPPEPGKVPMSTVESHLQNSPAVNAAPAESDLQALEHLRKAHKQLRAEIGKIIIGQEAVLDQLLMAIFCRG